MWYEGVGRSRLGLLLSLQGAKWEQVQEQGQGKDLQVGEEREKVLFVP